MIWTAPEVVRTNEPYVADERTMLEGWLDYHRETLLLKCAGLTAEQLTRRSAEPSTLSLLGLVRHMADVERFWFRRHVAGESAAPRFSSKDNPGGEFDVEGAEPPADMAAFRAEVEAAREAVRGRSLDETFQSRWGAEISVRWVYVHMIEEYARHNGHADLLRERIDGVTGD